MDLLVDKVEHKLHVSRIDKIEYVLYPLIRNKSKFYQMRNRIKD